MHQERGSWRALTLNGSESPLSPSDENNLAVTQGGGARNCIRGLAIGPGVTRLSLGHSEDEEDVDSLDPLENPRAPVSNTLDNEIILKWT